MTTIATEAQRVERVDGLRPPFFHQLSKSPAPISRHAPFSRSFFLRFWKILYILFFSLLMSGFVSELLCRICFFDLSVFLQCFHRLARRSPTTLSFCSISRLISPRFPPVAPLLLQTVPLFKLIDFLCITCTLVSMYMCTCTCTGYVYMYMYMYANLIPHTITANFSNLFVKGQN